MTLREKLRILITTVAIHSLFHCELVFYFKILLLFQALREVELEQPVFGANYIKGKVISQPNGNWEGEAKFKLHFKSGGAIDFGTAMLRAAQMGKNFRRRILH